MKQKMHIYLKFVVLIALLALISVSCKKQKPIGTVLTNELVFTNKMLKGDILFIGGYHTVTNHKGETTLAKQNQDFTGYIPINGRSDSGYVIVNHELMLSDPILGDGGGMTVFTVYKNPRTKKWVVIDDKKGQYRNVDFSEVGGTFFNCSGFETLWGTVLTGEETVFKKNQEIFKDGEGITDTSDFIVKQFNGATVSDTIQRFENFNWMVEVDVANAKAIRKNYNMGRYSHEGGVMLPNGKTVILTDDSTPGFIYKFEAKNTNDLSEGQLYAYQQHPDGNGGKWLEMPMDLQSMIHCNHTAATLGATMFIRKEWAVHHNNKIYITETGNDDTEDNLIKNRDLGATLAMHLQVLDKADGKADFKINDYYGRILELDMETGHLRVYLEGGQGKEHHFASPDGLALTYVNGKPVLMVNEDLIGHSHGRVPAAYNQRINEIFCLDLSLQNPTVDDLHKLAVGPDGCETTGGRFTPDGSTYFVNVQHPATENKFPFNNSTTIAVRNINKWIAKTLWREKVK
jgi:secreted PhoX family phosphatase